MAYYLDTSALVKLVVAERETAALLAWLRGSECAPVASDLARAELMRAVRRASPERAVQAHAVLDAITLIRLESSTFEAAGRLDPQMLRTLDAVHVAAALDLGDDLEGMVTYDERMADAARANGIPVLAPS